MRTSKTLPMLRAMCVALCCALCLTACKTSSNLLLPEPIVKAEKVKNTPLEAPTVDCKKPSTSPTPKPPCADCWVNVVEGVAMLSQQASTWIVDVLGLLDKERALRAEEHRCLDEHETRGVIKQ